MAAIYCISIFLFFYYFGIGYRLFEKEERKLNKIILILSAIILRLFVIKQSHWSFSGILNMIIDLGIGYMIYRIAKDYYDENKSLFCASFYLFNPVLLIYTYVWNQKLILWSLLIILGIDCVRRRKLVMASILYIIAQYTYIGTIMFLPVMILVIMVYIKEKGFKLQGVQILAGVGVALFVCYFEDRYLAGGEALNRLIEQMNPEYMNYNTCNLWALIGWNWKFIGGNESIKFINPIVLIGICGMGYYLKRQWQERPLHIAYISFISIFLFVLIGIGVHEYFMLPIILVLLIHFILSGNHNLYRIYVGISVLHFVNQIYSVSLYNPNDFNANNSIVLMTSFLLILTFIGILIWLFKEKSAFDASMKQEKLESIIDINKPSQNKKESFDKGGGIQCVKFEKRDYISVLILTVVFIYFSLTRLGSFSAPQTTFNLSEKNPKEVILDLGEEVQVDHLAIFLGRQHARKIALSSYDVTKQEWEVIGENINIQSVFAWNNVEVKKKVRYLGIVAYDDETYFNELAIVGEYNQLITPINTKAYPELFDEQQLFVAYPTYYHQTFFDEVYHARTAYEFIHHYIAYETTHPPLGKTIISLGIRLFGMNPFGWRIMCALFGIAMVPLMYVFAKRLFQEHFIAMMTTLLLVMDFMHFALSRIATLDILIGFFILLMYYFMYQYVKSKSLVALGLCGITMGIGIATKWTGVYAGAGLAVIFFSSLWEQYKVYEGEKKRLIREILGILSFCVLFFVMIPIGIYCLSYIPFVEYTPSNGLISKVLNNMKLMYSYHSQLVTTHPFESRWYEWPWIKVPLFQALQHNEAGLASAVSALGNPLVWWPGMISVFYVFKRWLWDRDKDAGFLSIAYSAQLIPWMFVSRNTFIYHYFPGSLFTILCSGYCIQQIVTRCKRGKSMVLIYGAMVVGVFLFFYPVLSGQWINPEWAGLCYRWLKTWRMV